MSSANPRTALSPDNLGIIEAVARLGSMAAAAREMGMVPSALTYRIRQVEDALDVLLFDRSSRRARLTPAGEELLRAGQHLLEELDAVAQRVKRVATGWEPQLTIAMETIVARSTIYELCEAFYAEGAPTRLKLREETLSGTLEALLQGQADLALGVANTVAQAGIQFAPLGSVEFVFAVAPHHPLASVTHKLSEAERAQHRAVAVSDSTRRGRGVSHNLAPGQDLLTVPTMHHKLEAQLRGLGAGFLPLPLAQPYIQAGRLVVKAVQNANPVVRMQIAWRSPGGPGDTGRALRWWLERLQNPTTRAALLNRHHQL
jgi:DNA-binding transcriptional LysR family regulator